MAEDNIKIGGIKGDVIVGSGTGNIVGKSVSIKGNVTISSQQLAKIPDEYAKSLEAFIQSLNQQLEQHRVSPEKAAPAQEAIRELAKEVEGVQGDQVGINKGKQLNARVSAVINAVVKVLPKVAETAATFTFLSPFSKLIGEGVEQLAKAIQREV